MKTIQTAIPAPRYSYPFSQPLEQIAFFDIETTGLSPKASSLYLIGAMHYDSDQHHWTLTQWFADDYQSEAAILSAFLEYLTPFQILYHFNGSTFDIPYLLTKCEKHQIDIPEYARELFSSPVSHQTSAQSTRISVDLLREIRPLKKMLHLPKANQTALEHWLEIHREDTYDGGQLISVYAEYMQKKILHPETAQELEHLLLLHNHDDIAGMLEVSSLFSYADCLHPSKTPAIEQLTLKKNNFLTVQFTLSKAVPRRILLTHALQTDALPCKIPQDTPFEETPQPKATLALERNQGTLTLPFYHGTLKYFFAPYKDYYYLPEEDTAIHKSVAQFVDANYRQKATASTCYTKKEGIFLPSCSKKATNWEEPLLYSSYKTAPGYYQFHQESEEASKKQLAQYLYYELQAFQ